MWVNKPLDVSLITKFQEELVTRGVGALEHFSSLGASEQDIADAIHYISQVYACPAIKNNVMWFNEVLYIILEIAFPNGVITKEAKRFAVRMATGIEEHLQD